MPELPEVEFTRQRLTDWLGKSTIMEAAIGDARLVKPSAPAKVARALTGQGIARVDRQGKWLRLVLVNGT